MLGAAGTGVSMSFGPKIGSEGGWTNAKKVLFSQLLCSAIQEVPSRMLEGTPLCVCFSFCI